MTQSTQSKPPISITAFWWLMLLFTLPYGLAWFLYQNPDLQQQWGRQTNRGTLINPVFAMQTLAFKSLDQQPFSAKHWQNRWTLFMPLTSAICEKTCQENLYKMRQVRLALGEDRQHIQRVLALLQTPDPALKNQLLQDYPDMRLTQGDSAAQSALSTRLGELHNRIFLVDTQGQLMMAYPVQVDAKDILKDLQRLLKVLPPADSAYKH